MPNRKLLILFSVFVLSACSSAAPTPTSIPPASPATPIIAQSADYKGIPQSVTPEGYLVLGSAQTSLTDYSDFMCSSCYNFVTSTEPILIENYVRSGKVRLVFRPILDFGERSTRASEAAVCAARAGQGWQMHDMLYAKQGELGNTGEDKLGDLMLTYGKTLVGMDQAKFAACIQSREALKAVQDADADRRKNNIVARPSFEISGQRFSGAQPIETFAAYIDAALKQP